MEVVKGLQGCAPLTSISDGVEYTCSNRGEASQCMDIINRYIYGNHVLMYGALIIAENQTPFIGHVYTDLGSAIESMFSKFCHHWVGLTSSRIGTTPATQAARDLEAASKYHMCRNDFLEQLRDNCGYIDIGIFKVCIIRLTSFQDQKFGVDTNLSFHKTAGHGLNFLTYSTRYNDSFYFSERDQIFCRKFSVLTSLPDPTYDMSLNEAYSDGNRRQFSVNVPRLARAYVKEETFRKTITQQWEFFDYLEATSDGDDENMEDPWD